MTMGKIGILNVGAGDTKLTFDKSNPAECIRSGRVVTDMLRRGYALLIEVDDGKGGTTTTRVREFREDVGAYIIADFDPVQAAEADKDDHAETEQNGAGPTEAAGEGKVPASAKRALREGRNKVSATREVPATATQGIAIARIAGG